MKTILLFMTGIIVTTLSYGGNIFSITLNDFSGVLADQQVDLNWTTIMEAGVDHFEIQRSSDGLNFRDIDSAKSKMEINTSAYQLQYSYTDAHPFVGASYYRIEVVGKDGSTAQSTIIEISNVTTEGTRIYPTVIQNNLVFVESDKNLQHVRMEIFDLSGRKISETDWENLSSRQSAQISKSGTLPTGTYVARLTASGESIKNQVVIVANY